MPGTPLILAIGDSLIAGHGLSRTDGFADQLERRLRRTRPFASVVNAGVSGNTTDDVLRRLPGVLSRLAERPDLAILQVGPNDVLRQVPPARTRTNLDAILTELARCGIPVLLTTVEPPAILRDRALAYLTLHGEAAAMHGVATCPFFPSGVLGHPAMVLSDRVHPNAAAISAVVEAMAATVERLLGDAAAHTRVA